MPFNVRAEAQESLDAVFNLRHSVEAFDRPLHTGVTHTLGAVPSPLTFVYLFADIPRHGSTEALALLYSATSVHADFTRI